MMLAIFKNPIYRIIWTSILFSSVAYSVENIVTMGLINHIDDQDIVISYYLAISCAVPILLTYLTSIVIDNYDQRWIRLISSLFATTSALGFIYAYEKRSMLILYITSVVVFSGMAFYWPSMTAYTSKVIPKDQLVDANTIDMMTYKLLGILFQGLGGFLTLWFPLVQIYIGVLITYALGDVILSSLIWYPNFSKIYKESDGTKEMEKNKMKGNNELFKEGWKYLVKRKSITHLIVMRTFMNMASGMSYPLIYYYSFNKFILKDSGTFTYSLFFFIEGIVSLIFSAIANKYCGNGIKRMLSLIIASTFMVVTGSSLYIFTQNIYMAITGFVLVMTGCMMTYIMMTTIIQKQVPDQIQGRILSISYTFRLFAWGASTIAMGYFLTYQSEYAIYYIIGMAGTMFLLFLYTIYIRLTFEIVDKEEMDPLIQC